MQDYIERHYFPTNTKNLIQKLGKERLLENLKQMLLIRNFEIRAESAYQKGFVGGFFHSYIGQEAIQTACLEALGPNHWWIATYRCHALALLLGATPNEIMAELYGRKTGNAKGRGGSMHLYTDRMLGGFAIVGGHLPIALGAAFSLKYKKIKDEVAVCFLGDGAVAQGSFHESLNLASLWNLPCLYVIENNLWGMGTRVDRAICVDRLAEDIAPSYGLKGYTFDGMDFFNCFAGFDHVYKEIMKTGRPSLVEVVTERFKGHSISDPGLYRTKEELEECKKRDPIMLLAHALEEAGFLDEESYKALNNEQKKIAIDAMKYAEQSPWPDVSTLEEDVYKN